MASLRNTLTDEQLEWLENNVDYWYNVDSTTITKYSTWSYILIMQLIPETQIANIIQLNNDGTAQGSAQRDVSGTGYWANVFNGAETTNMYYYYLNHGDNQADSVETIGIPTYPATRIVVDTQDLIAVKDSNWTWLNLYKVIRNLTGISAIPELTKDQQALAYAWDSNMSYRIFSPYMMAWVKGLMTEPQIASYLVALFGDKWNKMYDAMTAEYNPLNNYKMHEEEHRDDVKDESTETEGSSSNASTEIGSSSTEGSNDVTETLNTTVTGTNDVTTEDMVYAFNSGSPSDASKQVVDGDSSTTTEGSNSNSEESSSSSNSRSEIRGNSSNENTKNYTTDNDFDRELDREGNIGVTTSQKLLQEELELRKNIILDTVRDDIINVMTLPYYGGKY